MNTYLFADVSNAWLLAGWTMIHFLWLGTLVALVAGFCRWLLRRASSNLRYVAALTSLVALAALPIAIAFSLPLPLGEGRGEGALALRQGPGEGSPPLLIEQRNPAAPSPTIELHNPATAITSAPPAPGAAGGSTERGTTSPLPTNPRQSRGLSEFASSVSLLTQINRLERYIGYLPWLWLIGTPITFALTATGLVGTRRLRRASRPIIDGPIAELLARLAASLRLGKRVTVAVCDRIASPVLIGILRPIILLPPAALTGYSPEEIEMVLLHELAHVRRWDNLVNLVQRVIESLLFFHPAVWLISNWVRREREACCDAVVVARTDHPHAYAELLVALAAQMPRSVLFHPAASSAMAAGPLRSRIRRILQLDDDPLLISGKSFTLLLVGLITAATLTILYSPTTGQAQPSNATTTENKDKKDSNSREDSEKEERQRFAHFEKSLKSIEIVIALFNDSAGYTSQLEAVHNALAKEHRSLDTWGLKVDAKSPDALKYNLTDAPTCIVFRNGKETSRLAPIQSAEQLTKFVEVAVTDDWPAGVVFPSPKEGDISTAAFRQLGLKIVPATKEEQAGGNGHTLKLIDIGLPPSISGPALLRKINEFEIKHYDDLDSALGKIIGDAALVEFVVDGPRGITRRQMVAHKPGATTSPAADPKTQNRSSKFPSLEEQMLADLAYRRLELELEPIDDTELQHVKALGYDGGVRVEKPVGRSEGLFQPGDILVGLHVWPTQNMKDVAQVLNRPDLAELNPLKFYIVRREQGVPEAALAGLPVGVKDVVRTGRISVSLGAVPPPLSTPLFRIGPAGPEPPSSAPEPSAEAASGPQPAYRSGEAKSNVLPGVANVVPSPSSPPQPTPPAQGEPSRPTGAPNPYIPRVNIGPPANAPPEPYGYMLPALPGEIVPPPLPSSPQEYERMKAERERQLARISQAEAALKSLESGLGKFPLFIMFFYQPDSPEGPIKFAPQWQEIKRQLGERITAMVVDVNNDKLIANYYNVTKVPTYIIFRRGQQAATLVGAQTTDSLLAAINNAESTPKHGEPAPTPPIDRKPAQMLPAPEPVPGVVPVITKQLAESILKVAIENVSAANKAKEEALKKRDEAQDPKAIEAAKRELEAADRDLEQANREFQETKRHVAEMQHAAAADKSALRYDGVIGGVSVAGHQIAASDKSALRYDGKSFDEWRDLWKTELSTEKRVEAIKALAAFGANGYGKEAAEAILDVAGEYDFSIIENDLEGALKQTVLRVLAPTPPRPSLAKYWLPDLTARIEKDPTKWKGLATHLFDQMRTTDQATIAALQTLAEKGPPELRNLALGTLVQSSYWRNGGPKLDDKTRQLLSRALQTNDATALRYTLKQMVYYPSNYGGRPGSAQGMGGSPRLVYFPELIPLLFNPDEAIRKETRGVLQYFDENDAHTVIKELLAVLNDKARQRDHVHAIRALGYMRSSGPDKPDVSKALAELCKQTHDKAIRIAAIVALVPITGPSDFEPEKIDQKMIGRLVGGGTEEEISALTKKLGPPKEFAGEFDAESYAIVPNYSTTPGSGSGFY